MYFYSIIIPVYNRPDELDELLRSLCSQSYQNFEVIVVEDGSSIPCKHIVDNYTNELNLYYFVKENGGPGQARNYGAQKATGEYLIILDSDCILPDGYLEAVTTGLRSTQADAFGGPDKASDDFTDIQKAINYSMTSFFTTGGIRGGKKELDKFFPRSFNMGIRKEVYEELEGFSKMRFGEDIDFSIRIYKASFKVCLFPAAWVYHKRRTDWMKFFRQVFNSGIARINLYKKYPDSLKIVHTLPALFTVGTVFFLIGSFFCFWSLLPLVLFAIIVCIDSTVKNRSLKIGILSIFSSYIQLLGYGTGFLLAIWNRIILKKSDFAAFEKSFYK